MEDGLRFTDTILVTRSPDYAHPEVIEFDRKISPALNNNGYQFLKIYGNNNYK